jgi:broad specificity phosphatase PhoE
VTVTFYFACHGETTLRAENRIQGHLEAPLTSEGIYEAFRIGRALAHVELFAACTSSSTWAEQTLSLALEARQNERAVLRKSKSLHSFSNTQAALDVLGLGETDWSKEAEVIERLLRTQGALNPKSALKADTAIPLLDVQWKHGQPRETTQDFELPSIEYPSHDIAYTPDELLGDVALSVRKEDRLRDWDWGHLQGATYDTYSRTLIESFGYQFGYSQQNERLAEMVGVLNEKHNVNMEEFVKVEKRLNNFLEECGAVVEGCGGGNVLVVTHEMIIRSLIFMYARDRVARSPRIRPGSISKAVLDGGELIFEQIGSLSSFS